MGHAVWIILLFMTVCKSAQSPAAGEENPIVFRPMLYLIDRHREEFTHYDGPRCPMYPSCAAYADRAIRQYGFLGALMFANRLFFAETGDLASKYVLVPHRMSEMPRYYDPVSDDILPGEHRPSLLMEDFSE